MGTPSNNQTTGSLLQTTLRTRTETRFFIGMLSFGGCFLLALAGLVIQQVYMARKFASHLDAGGVDDPDAVFGHFDPIVLVAPLTLLISFIGVMICTGGWLIKRGQRYGRERKQARRR
jgi:hypothetical protein